MAVGIVITLLTLLFLFIFIKQQRQALSDTIHSEQYSLQKQITLLVNQTSKNYKSRILSLITSKTKVMNAFAAGDREKLLQQSEELLEIFKKENIYFKSLFFIKPDNIVFFRVQSPELYGDDVSFLSPMAKESTQTQKMHYGFEIVKHGLQYRIVHPVFVDKKFIGLIGFGLDAAFFLDQLNKTNHDHLHEHSIIEAGIALFFPKIELSKTILLDKAYKTIGNHAVFSCGNPYFQELPEDLDLEKEIQQIKLNGITHALIHSADFMNFKGDVIAGGLSLINIENIASRAKRDILMTIIFALGLLSFAFVILYFNFNILFKKIAALNNSLEQSNKELENRVEERTEALRESDEKFRMLFEEAPDAIFTEALDDQIIDANAAASKMLGYTREEFQTMTVADIQAPEMRGKPGLAIQKELSQGNFFEGLDLHKNGHTVPIEVHNHKMHIKGQDIVLSVVRDISQRKKAEEKLRESEERLKAIFLANPDPVAVYDVDGYPLYLNPAFTEVFGWSLGELQGKHIPFVPKDQQEKAKSKIKEIYESGIPVQFETTRLSKDGKTISILLSAAIIKDIQGIHNGLVVNLKDITDRKKLETQLQQAQKMEAIGTLAGGIAHDFNNILSGIFGFAQLAKNHVADPEKANKDIERIIDGAQKASDLVQQILTFSRKSTNKKQPLIISVVIKEALKLLRASIPTTIAIEKNIISRAVIMADPTKIHQIIMNLCTNAFHSMQDAGGVLTVELIDKEITRNDSISRLKILPGKYLRLEVGDTGPGIDPEILDNIFDPYFTTKKAGKGTGMGLAVVHGIVKEHRGHIQVLNKPGTGSSFHVYFPVSEEFVHDIPKIKKDILPGGSERIMLIDDEETILEVTKIFLEHYGYKVYTFSDGVQAMEVFKKNPYSFDLVITDMTMPGMTGEKLAIEILKIRSDLPIIICSGYSGKISGDRARAIGIKKFLAKPIPMNDLARTIRDLLNDSAGQG